MPSKYGEKVEEFYRSTPWKTCRLAFIRSKLGICEICGCSIEYTDEKGIKHNGKRAIVHHRIPISDENMNDIDITLNFDNLELLCLDCHNSLTGDMTMGRTEKPTVAVFDNNGNVKIVGKK